ncbi:MAG: acyl-CoA thioesterase [Bacteroidales bacterium]|nr:acyl-CoA thioesterase [Bacteroidales bacterium]
MQTKHLFGGEALKWMDEVAYITATKFTRKKMYTVYIDNIKFLKPIFKDNIVYITGKVVKADYIRIYVEVIMSIENFNADNEIAIRGDFTFVALDENGFPLVLNNSYEEKKQDVD